MWAQIFMAACETFFIAVTNTGLNYSTADSHTTMCFDSIPQIYHQMGV